MVCPSLGSPPMGTWLRSRRLFRLRRRSRDRARSSQLVKRHLLQRFHLRTREPQLEARALAFAQRPRIATRDAPKDDERLEVVPVRAGVVVIERPEIHLLRV